MEGTLPQSAADVVIDTSPSGTPPSETPPPNPEIITKQTKILVAVFIGIILLGVLVVVGLLYNRSRQVAQPLPSASASPSMTSPSEPAVAINTANWKTYTDPEVGFSFKYPAEALFNSQENSQTLVSISLAVEKLADIPEQLPQLMGREDALAQKAQLATGEGVQLAKLGSVYGQTATDLSQFEICSTFFQRKLTFYPRDYRVIIFVAGPKDKIVADMPDYFHIDSSNCGTELVWNRDKLAQFISQLELHQGQGMGQEWYDTFDALVATIQVSPQPSPTSLPDPSPSAQTSDSVYHNTNFGFKVTYGAPYRLLTDADNLQAYPHGVALLYAGGQVYDIIIEVWDAKSEYENQYGPRVAELTVKESQGKFITLLNNNDSEANREIIDSFELLP